MASQNRTKPFKPPRQVGCSSDRPRETIVSRESKSSKRLRTGSSPEAGVEQAGSKVCVSQEESSPSSDSQEERTTKRKARQKDILQETNNEIGLPANLLSTLLREHFQYNDTKITKEAMAVFRKYIELFVMEAIGRANEERDEVAHRKDNSKNAQTSPDFLEVEDLERLAPQLLLDF